MKSILLAGILAASAAVGSAAFVINEIDPDTPGTDVAEFIELKGNPNESVAGLSLVFFNGGSTAADPKSYLSVDLVGQANAQGYFVLGMSGVPNVNQLFALSQDNFQNGEDAVALYQRAAADFPNGTSTNGTGLLDVIAHETGSDADATWTGFGVPVTVFNENAGGQSGSQSLSRVPDGTGTFVTQLPTPGAVNEVAAQPSAATLTPVNGIFFGRFNKDNFASPVARTVTLTNTGGADFTVTSFQVDPSSDAQFSSIPAGVPVTLTPGQSIQMQVFFANDDVSATQVFEGSVSYSSDAQTNPSGSIPLRAEFVKVVSPATGAGQLVINEVVYNNNAGGGVIVDYNLDGVSNTTEDEFIEIYNPGGSAVNITGWEFETINASSNTNSFIFGENTIIPAGGFLAAFGGGNVNGFPAGTATTTTLQLTNGGLLISLGDGNAVVDAVSYLNTNDDPDADGYTNLPAITDGNSVGRRPDGSATFREFVHNDSNAADRPTPGASNNGGSSVSDWQLF